MMCNMFRIEMLGAENFNLSISELKTENQYTRHQKGKPKKQK